MWPQNVTTLDRTILLKSFGNRSPAPPGAAASAVWRHAQGRQSGYGAMRIAVIHISQETNDFNPQLTTSNRSALARRAS
jgi:hypothetical protein